MAATEEKTFTQAEVDSAVRLAVATYGDALRLTGVEQTMKDIKGEVTKALTEGNHIRRDFNSQIEGLHRRLDPFFSDGRGEALTQLIDDQQARQGDLERRAVREEWWHNHWLLAGAIAATSAGIVDVVARTYPILAAHHIVP